MAVPFRCRRGMHRGGMTRFFRPSTAAVDLLIMFKGFEIFARQEANRLRRTDLNWLNVEPRQLSALLGRQFRPYEWLEPVSLLGRHAKVATLAPKSTVKLSPSFTVRAEP